MLINVNTPENKAINNIVFCDIFPLIKNTSKPYNLMPAPIKYKTDSHKKEYPLFYPNIVLNNVDDIHPNKQKINSTTNIIFLYCFFVKLEIIQL